MAFSTEKFNSTCPLWTWKPISPGKDQHSESACQSETLSHGFEIIGARVRGKKHKHEGTNCDDWFEIARSGEWNIIAVSDGAGSKMFSRVGARVACQTAVNYLVKQLQKHHIKPRQEWTADTFARNEIYQFKEPDIELTQKILHEAIQSAYYAIEEAFHARDQLKYYYKALGNRDLTLSDFSTTLLLAIHTRVHYKAAPYSLVLTCQIGDGMTAAICQQQSISCLLGKVEKNHFGGETQFLTSSKRQLERNYLATINYSFFSQMRALMVMTDGVSDDYFPPDKNMLRLFGDLILNGIIPISTFSSRFKEKEILRQNDYLFIQERLSEKGSQPTPICSVSEYAKIINIPIEKLIATPAWLVAGIPKEILESHDISSENRLLAWLDTYNIRGSFDDRTLVVLTKEF